MIKNTVIENILNERYETHYPVNESKEMIGDLLLGSSVGLYQYLKHLSKHVNLQSNDSEFNPLEEPNMVKTIGQQYPRPTSFTYTRVPGFQLSRATTIA